MTLSSGTLAQSPVARQPFMGKLMSVAPLAGSLWMLRDRGGVGVGRRDNSDRQRETKTERFQGPEPRLLGREVGRTITGLLLAQDRCACAATQPHHARGCRGYTECTGRRALGA